MAEQTTTVYRAERKTPGGRWTPIASASTAEQLAPWMRAGVRIVPESYTPMVTPGGDVR